MSNIGEVRQVIGEVIARWGGRIGTHYETCWQTHAACLAVLVRDLLDEEDE